MILKRITNSRYCRIIVSIIAIGLIVFMLLGCYFAASRFIKYTGIILTPSKEIPVHEITYYLQNDPQWSSDKIGYSNYSMGSSGCLISSVASAITELGIEITPQELNDALTNVNGYSGADLIWYKINEAVPQADYKYSRIFSSGTIEKDLKAGLLPIVNVKFHGGGVTPDKVE